MLNENEKKITINLKFEDFIVFCLEKIEKELQNLKS